VKELTVRKRIIAVVAVFAAMTAIAVSPVAASAAVADPDPTIPSVFLHNPGPVSNGRIM
jgi:hypothetical protein